MLKNPKINFNKIIDDYIYPEYFGYKDEVTGKYIKSKREHIIRNLFAYDRIYEMSGRVSTKSTEYPKMVIYYMYLLKWMNCLGLKLQAGGHLAETTFNDFTKAINEWCRILSKGIIEQLPFLNYETLYNNERRKWQEKKQSGNHKIIFYRNPKNKNYFQQIVFRGLDANKKFLEGGESKIKGFTAPHGFYGIMILDEAQQVEDKNKIDQALYTLRAPKGYPVVYIELLNADSHNHFSVKMFQKEGMFTPENEKKLAKGIAIEKVINQKVDMEGIPDANTLLRVSNVYVYRDLIKLVSPKSLKDAEIDNQPDNQLAYKRDWLGIPQANTDDIYPYLNSKVKIDYDWELEHIYDIQIGVDIGLNGGAFAIAITLYFANKSHTPYYLYYHRKNKIFHNSLTNNRQFRNLDVSQLKDLAIEFIWSIYEKHPILKMTKLPIWNIDDNTQGWITLFKQSLFKYPKLIYPNGNNVRLAIKTEKLSRITLMNDAMRFGTMTFASNLQILFYEMKNIKIINNKRADGNDDMLEALEYTFTDKYSTHHKYIAYARKELIRDYR